ncbi:uncharacterized protein LOC113867883 [Abrus precatorius]|uniref:Uncharacterized protein LOC113867883 n=1 Tax=Abrus precatorius TaxID=3816 RepID=A0A8B8LTS2_ABRPR|nr:uncharacterized protein LOC113867883 [Abrus precatorius]
MEIERCQPVVAKKLWNIIRIVFLMLRKGIAKSKVAFDFNVLIKRGKLAAGKAIANTLTLHQRSRNDVVYPRDYEFSCSNSPAFPFHKRKHYHYHHCHRYDDVSAIAVQKVLEMLNNNKVEASPLVTLPGFGKSPIGKQLRITDSPFPLKEEEVDNQVDVAAEEFIKRFYKDLNLQHKLLASIDSPSYHYNSWDR